MRWVGFFPTRTRTRKKKFSTRPGPGPDPTLTRLNPNIKNEKKILFYPKMKSFHEEKKSLKVFFPCNQNSFCFCWLKWIFCRFKLSIHIFLSRLKSNLSWSELTRIEPEPEFFFLQPEPESEKKKFSTRTRTLTRPEPTRKSQPDASLSHTFFFERKQKYRKHQLNAQILVTELASHQNLRP